MIETPAEAASPLRTAEVKTEELLIFTVARLLSDLNHVAVGASSPIPGAGALLAQELSGGKLRVSMLGSREHSPFTDGGRELFDCAAQGRIDAFFLGGIQIDGAANINLLGLGSYPKTHKRFAGSFGSAYLYHLIPRVILFTLAHNPKVLVPKVDFVSAAGTSEPQVFRPGGPKYLMTNRCLFDFDQTQGKFSLNSIHAHSSHDDVKSQTGFDYASDGSESTTPVPDAATLKLIRTVIASRVAETYPKFAESVFNI